MWVEFNANKDIKYKLADIIFAWLQNKTRLPKNCTSDNLASWPTTQMYNNPVDSLPPDLAGWRDLLPRMEHDVSI